MTTYRSREELEGKTLELNDIVIFTVKGEELRYEAICHFLAFNTFYHSLIFNKLGIEDKYAFASNAYGYKSGSGDFPVCRNHDYSALTRIAIALFDECEKVNMPTLADGCENAAIPSLAEARKTFRELTKHYTLEQLSENRPSMSWDEYLERHPTAERTEDLDKRLEALRKLVLLRDEWRGEWKPSYGGISWRLVNRFGEYNVAHASDSNSVLSFPTEGMAEDFLETFRPLIEQAGDLI